MALLVKSCVVSYVASGDTLATMAELSAKKGGEFFFCWLLLVCCVCLLSLSFLLSLLSCLLSWVFSCQGLALALGLVLRVRLGV